MAKDCDSDFVTLASRIAYRNPWITVREDRIRRPDGTEGLYGVVEKPNFVVVVPVHHDNMIELVEQYRYPIGERLWELSMGVWQRGRGDPRDAARGELREETGLIAGRPTHAGRLIQAPGLATARADIFIAEQLERGARDLESTEADMVTRAFPAATVLDMIADNRIVCMVSVAAIGLLLAKGLYPGAAPAR